ncbi:hypothetical protein AVEN_109844-1 [Araneus ventricosus]|uniref:Retrotransposon gag domain-containing protein n=1 Tax=Araneus ventricosus TaxID=182803 RepID=A0A4Y2L549_ARAVE|nr:hypothetical protein AVEN_109844-1 [Araneus ventricosus]
MPEDTEVKEVKPQPSVLTPALFWEPGKPKVFKGEPAKKRFDNNEDFLTSWEVFQTELKKVFAGTQLYVRRAKDILKRHAQKSGESTQSYIQDVLGHCHLIDSNMPEDDKVSHLMKGIAEDVYQALLTKEIRTTADFIKWCQHIEERQQRRI